MKLKKIAAAGLAAAMLAVAVPVAGALSEPFSVAANADDALTEGDYTYTVNEDGETVTITEYNGTEPKVVIPETLGGKNVTSIGDNAFYNCESLTSVTIPDSVTTMGNSAFSSCKSLTSVILSDSVTEIGAFTFGSCTSLENVAIPDSVTKINCNAFANCTLLASISVDENNPNFSSADGILFNKDKSELVRYPINKKGKSYTIPNSVTEIGDKAFNGCTSLTSITIPDSVTQIDNDVFWDCTSLTNITIPNSVTTIGGYAFNNCTSLSSITIPNSVIKMGDCVFFRCASLTSILIGENNQNYSSVDGVLFNKDKSELICYPAGKKDKSYTIPDNVTTIKEYAFRSCTLLTSVTIPDSVMEIINSNFCGETSLASISVDENNPNYSSVDGVLFNKDKSTLFDYPAGKKDKSYTIPDGVTTIAYAAFSDSPLLTSIIIPDSATEIEDDAFENCESLTSVFIPNSVTKIGGWAFNDCTSLTSITIPDSVTKIGGGAFYNCTSLTNITIPDSVTEIAGNTFSDTSIATVNYSGTKSEWEAITINYGNDCLKDAEIICTDGIINKREHETSDPTSSDTSEPTSSDTSAPDESEPDTSIPDESEPDTSIPGESEPDTSAPDESEPTVEIVDEDTGVKTEVSTEDKELDGAEFEVTPADHPTLKNLINKIVENAAENVQKSLEEAAESIKNGHGFAYDMCFKKNGKEVQPDKEVTITVPVPEKFKNDIDRLNVYHLTDRGAVYVPSWIKGGSIMYKTRGFSPYVITLEKLANAVSDEDDVVTPDDTDNNDQPNKPGTVSPDDTNKTPGGSDKTPGKDDTANGTDQKGTGVALAIAPVILACAVVAVASKKKK